MFFVHVFFCPNFKPVIILSDAAGKIVHFLLGFGHHLVSSSLPFAGHKALLDPLPFPVYSIRKPPDLCIPLFVQGFPSLTHPIPFFPPSTSVVLSPCPSLLLAHALFLETSVPVIVWCWLFFVHHLPPPSPPIIRFRLPLPPLLLLQIRTRFPNSPFACPLTLPAPGLSHCLSYVEVGLFLLSWSIVETCFCFPHGIFLSQPFFTFPLVVSPSFPPRFWWLKMLEFLPPPSSLIVWRLFSSLSVLDTFGVFLPLEPPPILSGVGAPFLYIGRCGITRSLLCPPFFRFLFVVRNCPFPSPLSSPPLFFCFVSSLWLQPPGAFLPGHACLLDPPKFYTIILSPPSRISLWLDP